MQQQGLSYNKMSEKISFKPLSKGLGFHPFSEGLPYENPNSQDSTKDKKRKSETPRMGAGAVAAGAPAYAPSIPNVVIRPSEPSIHRPVAAPAPTTTTQSKTSTPTEVITEFQPSGLYIFNRGFAFLVDYGINLAVIFGAVNLVLLQFKINPSKLLGADTSILAGVFFVLFSWCLVTAQEIAFGTSIGKRIFGLRLEGSAPKLLMRAVLFVPSLLAGIGILMSLFREDRKCLHDALCDLQPIEFAHL